MKQRFFKLNSRWYADVSGHTLEENEMVCGADSLLEEISKFLSSPEVTLDLDVEPSDFPFATLIQIEHDACGATYKVESSLNTDLVWICNVTHDVLGEHPERIYINSIS
jgi:hypothetical protein